MTVPQIERPATSRRAGDQPRVFRSKLLTQCCPWLQHGFSARDGGVSAGAYASLNLGLHVRDSALAVLENRRRFIRAALGPDADPERAIAAEQIHGGVTVRVGDADAGRGALSLETVVSGCDALATDRPLLPLLLFFADCVPILIAHPARRVFCVAHAGWRGTAAGIAMSAVQFLRDRYDADPAGCAAWIAPAIGPCCYEVDETVLRAIQGYEGPPIRGRLDLKAENRRQLERAGLRPDRIEASPACTSCGSDHFFSYRRDGATGRMGLAALID